MEKQTKFKTAQFLWMNFSGSYQSFDNDSDSDGDSDGECLWESSLSFYKNSYGGEEIEESKSVCGCGECKACKISFAQKSIEFSTKITKIKKGNVKIEYDVFCPEFYQTIFDTIREHFGIENVLIFDSNIIIISDDVNIPEIIKKFTTKISENGYTFTGFLF